MCIRDRVVDEDQNVISTETVDVDGGKVGDAAQFSAGLGLDVDLAERLSFDTDVRFYDELYANVGAVKENLELPNYHIFDMGLSYKMLLDSGSLNVRLNVNNVFDNMNSAFGDVDDDEVRQLILKAKQQARLDQKFGNATTTNSNDKKKMEEDEESDKSSSVSDVTSEDDDDSSNYNDDY